MPSTTYSRTVKGGQQSRASFSLASAMAETDECILWPFWRDEGGHGHTRHEGVRRTAHWVACYLRNGPPPAPGMHAAHSCHNNGCVNGKHLEWQTPLENIRASVTVGKHIRGERVHTAKLAAADVAQIKQERAAGALQQDIADRYGLSAGYVSRLLAGHSWKYLDA